MSLQMEVPTRARASQYVAAVRACEALHARWVTPPRTVEVYHAGVLYLDGMQADARLVVNAATDALVGAVTLGGIYRGPLHSAYLGYYVFAGFERQGWMRQAVSWMLRHAFATLKLHRLEANIQPDSHASIALAERLGFAWKGFPHAISKSLDAGVTTSAWHCCVKSGAITVARSSAHARTNRHRS